MQITPASIQPIRAPYRVTPQACSHRHTLRREEAHNTVLFICTGCGEERKALGKGRPALPAGRFVDVLL